MKIKLILSLENDTHLKRMKMFYVNNTKVMYMQLCSENHIDLSLSETVTSSFLSFKRLHPRVKLDEMRN